MAQEKDLFLAINERGAGTYRALSRETTLPEPWHNLDRSRTTQVIATAPSRSIGRRHQAVPPSEDPIPESKVQQPSSFVLSDNGIYYPVIAPLGVSNAAYNTFGVVFFWGGRGFHNSKHITSPPPALGDNGSRTPSPLPSPLMVSQHLTKKMEESDLSPTTSPTQFSSPCLALPCLARLGITPPSRWRIIMGDSKAEWWNPQLPNSLLIKSTGC
jgi:hypothetical protein